MPDQSLDRAAQAVGELSTSVRALTSEVEASEALRTRKIRALYNLMYIVVPAMVLLLILAITNFSLLSRTRDAADASRKTNELLVGCFQPGTQCADENRKATQAVLDQVRQTQFVIAICQRQNPVDDDPTGTKIVACVQSYYPTFRLPARVVR